MEGESGEQVGGEPTQQYIKLMNYYHLQDECDRLTAVA